jgi:hypothetical protein
VRKRCFLYALGVALLAWLPPAAAWSEPDASVPDAPDASVGQGGSDQNQQEGDDITGRVVTVCNDTRDCTRGFSCRSNRCVYVGIREAEQGCLLGFQGVAVLLGIALAMSRRRPG